MQFRWDADVLQKEDEKKCRKKNLKLSNYTYTLEEIQNKVKEQGADATAKELGLSRSRFYGRLKKAKDSGSYYFLAVTARLAHGWDSDLTIRVGQSSSAISLRESQILLHRTLQNLSARKECNPFYSGARTSKHPARVQNLN